PAVGHWSTPGAVAGSLDRASAGLCHRPTNRLARQQFRQGDGQIATAWSCPLHADQVLIVDPSTVAKAALAVEDEHFRGARGAEPLDDGAFDLAQNGERN